MPVTQKRHSGVLHQLRTPPQGRPQLSGMAADNRKGKDETGHARRRPGIGRGETGAIPRYMGRKAISRRNAMKVFVLDRHKKPLMPCTPRRARKLMESGRARVHKRFPFTIRLTDRTLKESAVQDVELRIDPGSRHTGFAVVRKRTRMERTMSSTSHSLSIADRKSISVLKSGLPSEEAGEAGRPGTGNHASTTEQGP